MCPSSFIYLPAVSIFVSIVVVPVSGSDFTTTAVSPPENVTVSPASNALVVTVYFKRGDDKLTTVPVAPLMLLVNVSSSSTLPETVFRTA